MQSVLRFRSRDVERVEETWQQFVPSAQLQRADRRDFRFDWASASLPEMSVVRYELAAGVASVVEPEAQILACRVTGGDAQVQSSKGPLPHGSAWITDGEPVSARWDGAATVRALIFDREAAERCARQISGDDRLTLTIRDASVRDADAEELWNRTFEYVLSALGSSAASDEVLRASLERHALTVTLSAFQTSFRDTMERSPQTRAAPVSVRRALAFIEANAHEPVTVDDVARAVHMSTRGLQRAFQRALDATPGEMLRRARLAGARRDLEQTDESVASIARRWGFSHPSRFAAYFRAEYGMLPGVVARLHR
ncbi:AraC family transcriptional regulator [Microbacterium sp. M28]|uniref:helix-turn-helix domain-containing protein n=1 Tax=Microbacterium sp. M28 TaxID=2962064 RepID=UPI0021F4B562|nr:AraC family transcriptional regulator [Microbacterium sp. M28]UYO96524.1 AraC family transcriptional regulator [Microbacterium sp. M28]